MVLKRELLIIPLMCLAFAHATGEEIRPVTVDYEPFYGSNVPYGGAITGIVRGYANPPEFYAANLHTEELNSDNLKLPEGRVCLVMSDRSTAKIMLANERSEYKEVLVTIEPPLKIAPLYVLISKSSAKYQA